MVYIVYHMPLKVRRAWGCEKLQLARMVGCLSLPICLSTQFRAAWGVEVAGSRDPRWIMMRVSAPVVARVTSGSIHILE